MNFLESVLASLTATYIPLMVGLALLLRRYRAVRKVWGIRAISISGKRYKLVMSSREDEPQHYRPGSSVAEAMVDLIIFFNDFWMKWLYRVFFDRPKLSAKIGAEELKEVNPILLGGPHFNPETKRHVERLARHDLAYGFKEVNGTWLLRDNIREKFLESDRRRNDENFMRNYHDYGIYIRAPHERPGHVVHIFAGNHGAGTRAAVSSTLRPHLCREIMRKKKSQQIGDFFVVLVKVQVRDFEPGEPEIVAVGALAVTPQGA